MIIQKKIIDIYSLKKIKENSNLAYSVLNPETSSDSPSAKSNGERFSSAIPDTQRRQVTNQGTNIIL
jgi:hypothetical protein